MDLLMTLAGVIQQRRVVLQVMTKRTSRDKYVQPMGWPQFSHPWIRQWLSILGG